MLRFFRHIRQKFFLRRPAEGDYAGQVLEGRVSKYIGYALGEIVLVIAGILIALQINTWNQNRLLRIEEREVISRTLIDLESDLYSLERRIPLLEKKDSTLLRVKKILEEKGTGVDPQSFLEDVSFGASYGWHQRRAIRSTYNDLIGAGKLGIIENSHVRTSISNYYTNHFQQEERIASRESNYPQVISHLIIIHPGTGGDSEVESELSEEQLDKLIRNILDTLTIGRAEKGQPLMFGVLYNRAENEQG